MDMKTHVAIVLFACRQNAGRSQMAAAFFNALTDSSNARAISAGTAPADHVHGEAVRAMREVGIDLAGAAPLRLSAALAAKAQLFVTMGCGEDCPVVPGLRRVDWPIADPKDQPDEVVNRIRDEIRGRVVDLVRSEGWSRPEAMNVNPERT
jgi:arsenate reductase (thioredoxin)